MKRKGTMGFCGRCGNPIPEWAQGGCPRCPMIKKERILSGRAGPKELRRRHKPPQPIWRRSVRKRTSLGPKQNRALPKPDTKSHLPHLDGFNRLLQDMYGCEMRFSKILTGSGIPQSQITIWRKDETWVLGFMDRLENALKSMLHDIDIKDDPCILMEHYLDNCPEPEIAVNHKLIRLEVRQVLDRYLAYLRSAEGHIAFRKIVSKCIEG
jgi:hypothetical protein